MASNNFHRSFVMLKTKDKGYGYASGKEPSGYIKLEVRKSFGRIQVYIQDLKPIKASKGAYELLFVSEQSSIAPLRFSAILPEHDGKFERVISFNPYNIKDSGYEFEAFKGIAVVFKLKGVGTVTEFPLVGYIDKHIVFDWKGDIMERLAGLYEPEVQNEYEKPEQIDTESLYENTELEDVISGLWEQVDTSESLRSENEDVSPIDPEHNEDNEIGDKNQLEDDDGITENVDETGTYDWEYGHDNANQCIVDYPNDFDKEPLSMKRKPDENQYGDDFDELSCQNFSSDDYKKDTIDDIKDTNFNDYKTSDDTYKDPYRPETGDMTYWDKVKQYFNGLFDRHRRLCPFDTIGEEDWVRIEHRDNPAAMHFRRPGNLYGPDANSIDHYLVGLRRKEGSVQYVIYAIPGVYSPIPPMSIHGLSKWLPVRGGYGTGYWLLYIDAKTGEIAYPD